MSAQIIRFKDIDRKDHGHFAGNNGRCALCEVRSFAKAMADRDARIRQAADLIRLTSK